MSHFTKIGGTGYQITSGKTKIGGTEYQITGGKTKIGGISYNINFNNLTLSELFANAEILGSIGASNGFNTNSSSMEHFPYPEDDMDINVYVIGVEHGSYFYIMKVLHESNASDWYTLLVGDDRTSGITEYISSPSKGFAFKCTIPYTQLTALYFPDFEESQVDALLSRVNITMLAERASTSTSTVSCSNSYITASENNIYLQSFYTGTGGSISSSYFSVSSGNAPTTALASTSTTITPKVYWRLYSSKYYLSSTGTGNTSLRAGSIIELSI